MKFGVDQSSGLFTIEIMGRLIFRFAETSTTLPEPVPLSRVGTFSFNRGVEFEYIKRSD